MRLIEGLGYGEIGICCGQRRKKARNQVGRQEGRIAGRRRHQRMRRGGERRMQAGERAGKTRDLVGNCLLYTSDAADERSRGDLGGRRNIKQKKKNKEETPKRGRRLK